MPTSEMTTAGTVGCAALELTANCWAVSLPKLYWAVETQSEP